MDNISEDQILEMNNVLSYRAKMTQQEMNIAINNINALIKECGAAKNGYTTTSTYAIETINGQQVMDVEILIPLDKEISVSSRYVFKKVFKLTNAVKIRHQGNPSQMQNSGAALMQYINDKKLVPITSGYNVTVKEPTSPQGIDSMIVDIYVGVSPNIL